MRFRAAMEHADPENVFKMAAVRDGKKSRATVISAVKKRHNTNK